jgi:cytochrome c biogenesis protein CcdA
MSHAVFAAVTPLPSLPTICLVATTAIIDSINPFTIGILILLVTVILGAGKRTGQLMLLGSVYIISVYVTRLLAGFGLAYVFTAIPAALAEYVSISVGLLIVLAGLVEIKDYFWYGRGFSLRVPHAVARKIHKHSAGKLTVAGTMLLGVFVAGIELPCTGAPYLAAITLLHASSGDILPLLLVLYNLVFIAPLLIILYLVASGIKVTAVQKWKEASKGNLRLAIGLLLIAMGWLLILIADGAINFG